jgi:phytoene dehydrogenase-like protein
MRRGPGTSTRAENTKKIIMIGAGIAGLSAGIYARKNGYAVTIYESHFLPGGMCTAWKREGYTFEGCMHYVGLVGCSPTHTYYDQWTELGLLPGMKMIQDDIFHTFQDRSGRRLNLYTDVDRLEKELLTLSPSDAQEIETLCTIVKRYAWFIRRTGRNPFLLIGKGVGILRAIPLLKKYADMSMGEYAARFSDPLIRYALTYLFGYPDFACTNIFFFLAGNHLRGTGFPQGSSLAFARRMERIFLELGGTIQYKTRVRRIVVQADRAAGIELEDGTIREADLVISAADGHATLFEMLADRFTPPALRERYESQAHYPPFIQVSLGISRDLTGVPHALKVQTALPFDLAGRTRQELWVQHFAHDPSMAPPGKTSLTVLFPSDLSWWEQFGYQTEAYQAEKKRIADTTIAQLEQVLPGIASQVETVDVATPFTTRRYVNNWKAGLGFMMTKKLGGEMVFNPQYTLPGLGGFYMIGLWVKGFGVPLAAASGKEVIRKICAAEGIKFKAS